MIWREQRQSVDAKEFMEERRKAIRGELNCTGADAARLAWWEATLKFPKDGWTPDVVKLDPEEARRKFPVKRPPRRPRKSTMKSPVIDPAVFEDTSDPDIKRDVLWVYANIHNQEASPPTPGAVSLLKWARESPDAFFRLIGQRVLVPEKQAPDDEDTYKASKEEKMHIDHARDRLQAVVREALNRPTGFEVICPECQHRFTPSIGGISDA